MRRRATWLVIAAVLLAAPAGAAVFTVGPGGTHTTIQAALDAAVLAGGANEVRVAAGTYGETLSVGPSFAGGQLRLCGGWDAAFTTRALDPARTVVDAAFAGTVLDARDFGGELVVEGLTFTRGNAVEGGGLHLDPGASGVARVRGNRIVGNGATSGEGTAVGAGVHVHSSDGEVELADNVVAENVGRSSVAEVKGAGVGARMQGTARLTVVRNLIADNHVAVTGGAISGPGLFVFVTGDAEVEVTDNLVVRSTAAVPEETSLAGAGAALWAQDSASLVARRNAFLGNGPTLIGETTWQVSLMAIEASTLVFTDSLVAAGAGPTTGGIDTSSADTGELRVVNVTIADNAELGLSARSYGGGQTVANSIVTGNHPDTSIVGDVPITTSTEGGDVKFVDPAHWDYRLRNGSPAVGAGNNAPPGGLGPADLAGGPRVIAGPVDQGAYAFSAPTSRFPVVTHAAGFGGTPWRTALSAANPTAVATSILHTYYGSGPALSGGVSVLAGSEAFFPDAVVFPVGLPATENNSGSLELTPMAGGVALASRTFADPGGGAGTYGQYLGAVGDDEMAAAGQMAILPLARSDTAYYTNVGMVNGTGASCEAAVRLLDPSGAQLGVARSLTVGPWGWGQLSDVFAVSGAGSHSAAYATVTPLTLGCRAWSYASVIDRLTKDPTTVPMQLPVAAGTVLRLPAAAHISGAGGTPWRTTLALVNRGSAAAHVTLVYRSGAAAATRTRTLAAHGTVVWDDLLVDLFGYGEEASTSGSVELWADQPLAVAGRSYADKGAAGTYGQALPALAVWRDGIGSLSPGVLASVRKDASFYTNVGFVNLGAAACQVRVTIFDDGAAIGSPVTRSVAVGQWVQVNDVFAEAGAGGAESAHAVVEVLTPGGRAWAYASVIDALSRDPTTIPLARPWVIGPDIT